MRNVARPDRSRDTTRGYASARQETHGTFFISRANNSHLPDTSDYSYVREYANRRRRFSLSPPLENSLLGRRSTGGFSGRTHENARKVSRFDVKSPSGRPSFAFNSRISIISQYFREQMQYYAFSLRTFSHSCRTTVDVSSSSDSSQVVYAAISRCYPHSMQDRRSVRRDRESKIQFVKIILQDRRRRFGSSRSQRLHLIYATGGRRRYNITIQLRNKFQYSLANGCEVYSLPIEKYRPDRARQTADIYFTTTIFRWTAMQSP